MKSYVKRHHLDPTLSTAPGLLRGVRGSVLVTGSVCPPEGLVCTWCQAIYKVPPLPTLGCASGLHALCPEPSRWNSLHIVYPHCDRAFYQIVGRGTRDLERAFHLCFSEPTAPHWPSWYKVYVCQ